MLVLDSLTTLYLKKKVQVFSNICCGDIILNNLFIEEKYVKKSNGGNFFIWLYRMVASDHYLGKNIFV